MELFVSKILILVLLAIGYTVDCCDVIIENIKNNDVFNHRLVILRGNIDGDPAGGIIRNSASDGLEVLNINSPNYDSKIETMWPINANNQFKGLIWLENDNNLIQFRYGPHCSILLTLRYEVNPAVEPIHLVVVAGSDSPLTYDVVPNTGQVNDYNSAVAKYRIMAWFWQAFIDDQVYKQNLGSEHRSFQVEEVIENGEPVPIVHLLRADITTEEVRANKDLYGLCTNTVKNSFLSGRKPANRALQVGCLLIDAHKLPNENTVVGHAGLGGGWALDYNLGIYGSQYFHAQPASLKELKDKFNDNGAINTNYTYAGMTNKYYKAKACNNGFGGFLQEIAHSMALNHNYGVMFRGFEFLNRVIFSVEKTAKGQWISVNSNSPDDAYPTFSRDDAIMMSEHHLLRIKTDVIVDDINRNCYFTVASRDSFTLNAPAEISYVSFYLPDPHDPFGRYINTNYYPTSRKSVIVDMSQNLDLVALRNNQSISNEVKLIAILQNGVQVIHNNIFQLHSSQVVSDSVFQTRVFGSVIAGQEDFISFFPANSAAKLTRITVFYNTNNYVIGMDFVYSNSMFNKFVGYKFRTSQSVVVDLTTKEIRYVKIRSGTYLNAIQFCYAQNDCAQLAGSDGTIFNFEFNLDTLPNANQYRVSALSVIPSIQYSILNAVRITYERI